jgi:hypothetical protein
MLASSFVRDILFGIIRHFATFGGGWLVAHGLLENSQLSGWVGSVCFLGGIAWSAFEKYQRHQA